MNATNTNPEVVSRHANTWIELDGAALHGNVALFKRLATDSTQLMAVVKSNAYGHGMIEVARLVVDAGAHWLGVFSLDEALALRQAGISRLILVFGPVDPTCARTAAENSIRLTVTSTENALELATTMRSGAPVRLHLKVETGTNRQGLRGTELAVAAKLLSGAGADIEGVYTHFADIEDTTSHDFAQLQLARFNDQIHGLDESGIKVPLAHTACSAAAILFPSTYFSMLRVGIALYGLWPSRETLVSAQMLGRGALDLKPVMTWKTRIAQIKNLEAGEYVGYGRTFRTTHATRLAVLPIGYADGYPRTLSNAAHVLVRGIRAPVRGRICTNLTMVDVTDVPGVTSGDEVVLLGTQGSESLTADDLARTAGTINYEIVTRAAPGAPRIVV